jgi:glycosyltransferase involved in cell wall biosynthesis
MMLPIIPRFYYCGKPDDGFGWGVCNGNLVRALGEFVNVIVDDGMHGIRSLDYPCLMPYPDHTLKPSRPMRCPRLIGYGFPEWPIAPEAADNAEAYHTVFAGSTWAANRLRAAGIDAEPLIQGVDSDLFSYQPWQDGEMFNVFSGGKFEYRKGQDIVLAAMGEFMARHSDVMLTIAWHNPWPETAESMVESKLIDHGDPAKHIPKDRMVVLPPLNNGAFPKIYAKTHVGLFPNRCEAGTNMVMTEYMACGRPVIATNAHGQADLDGPGMFPLEDLTQDHRGWFTASVPCVLAQLEMAYAIRNQLAGHGLMARENATRYTWRESAQRIVNAAFS